MLHVISVFYPLHLYHFFWLRGWDRNNRNDLVAWLFPYLLLCHSAINLSLKSISTSLKVNLITSTHLHFFRQFKAIWVFSPFHWKLFHWSIILIQNLVGMPAHSSFLAGGSHGERNLVGYCPVLQRAGHDWATFTHAHIPNIPPNFCNFLLISEALCPKTLSLPF